MGGFLHLIDFHQGSMARKIAKQKRLVDGLEAPRNSLELPVEASQSYFAEADDVPYTYEETHEWSEKNHYPTKAPMKKLINEEISTRPNNRRNALSVVARLMGVDMLPSNSNPVCQQTNKKNEKQEINYLKKEWTRKGSVGQVSLTSNSAGRLKLDSFQNVEDRDPDPWSGSTKLKKTGPREHPQEEELQKFKKEFEAWQAARYKECSKVVELDSIPGQWLAKGNRKKDKMAFYGHSGRMAASEKPIEPRGCIVKASPYERGGSQHHGYENELVPTGRKESSGGRTLCRDFELSPLMNSYQKFDRSSAPAKIVILRPGTDRIVNSEEPWASSSGTSEERGGIEDFLEEVKERLKRELQGKTLKKGMVRGGGIETPYSEKPSNPKQIAQHIAKQVRESVTRDLGTNLLRSESTRCHRSEIHFNGTDSPEFINRDTRNFLSDRLRNVLNRETHLDIPMLVHGRSRTSILDNGRSRLEQSGAISNAGNKMSHLDCVENASDMHSRSFRCGPDGDVALHRVLSPRNLIRSLSAPVSGTSFGKLLLEDRHIVTGAHIRRKHEAFEKVTLNVKKGKKEKFNIRQKVSSFKVSFTLKGKLFGRKIQSARESHSNRRDFVKDIMSGPTVIMNLNERYDNSTEVPPSPASVCSSVNEEFWRQVDHPSQTPTPDLPPLEDDASPQQIFREISSDLNELRKQLNQLGTGCYEETVIEEHPPEVEAELGDETEVYIRDLLVASGLYDSSSNISLSRWDALAKPINFQVLEEVEESCRKKAQDHKLSNKDDGQRKVDHKVLLDLLNEALSTVLGPPVTMSGFRKKALGPMARHPHGRELLDRVWEIIRGYIYPSTEKSHYSLDTRVAQDLHNAPWVVLMDDDVNTLGKEMECHIFGDLVEEIVKDMLS